MKLTLKNLFGDKRFNRLVLSIALPIVIQNGITNFVNLLDNIMIGQVGTEQMSGVAIVNQLMFVFNLCIFGGIAGAGIFTAQYFGSGDEENMRYTVRYKIIISAAVVVLFAVIFWLLGGTLVSYYITTGDGQSDPVLTHDYAMQYLKLIMIQMPFFAISQVYAGTLRETNQTKIPMIASIVAFLCNLAGNYILIFGKLGLPALGVKGAAIATVTARFAEMLVLIIYSHVKRDKYPAFRWLYKSIRLPLGLFKNITKKGLPILFNETLWSISIALLAQIYSRRGLEIVAAYNIASTINNLFSIVILAMGSTVSIIVGNYLGSGKTDEAVVANTRLTVMSVIFSVIMGGILIATSSLFPRFYNTTDHVKEIAATYIFIFSCFMPVNAFVNCAYFTLRAGGKTFITMLFDSVYEVALSVPTALILVTFTNLSAPLIYAVVWGLVFIKGVIGFILISRKLWINDLTKMKS